ncbi:hypothetical protein BG621_08010 [Parasaccharibacter apium]|nr:hypothetical protein BG621_08010 [Parasaccharibacter apium]
MSEKRPIGEDIFQWWKDYIAPRVQGQSEDEAENKTQRSGGRNARQGAARALSARLRRSTYSDILSEPDVSELVVKLSLSKDQLKPFAYMLHVISFVRHNVPDSLAKRLKGADEKPVMSHARFRKLMTAERDEVASLLRRAVTLVGYECNVSRLVEDMMFWGDQTRTRWCLDYFRSSVREEVNDKRPLGEKVLQWWENHVAPRVQGDSGDYDPRQSAARALSARLRRSTYPDILFEPTVSRLVVELSLSKDQLKPFAYMLHVISFVRRDVSDSLAKRLKGADETPVMSHMRFKQLMTAGEDEVASLLRRAVTLVGYECNVARLAGDMMFWNDQTRTRWCLDYFGVPSDSEKKAEPSQA